jgi:hypothetical protein
MPRNYPPSDVLFLALSLVLTIALGWRAGLNQVTCSIGVITVLYALNMMTTVRGDRRWFLGNCCMAWAGYLGSTSIIESLRQTPQHAALLAADRWLMGETPSVALSSFEGVWIGETLSAGYLSYQVYIHWVFVEAFFKSNEWRERCGGMLFTAFAVGFAGYLALPSSPPAVAFPELYSAPLAGGWLMRLNDALNAAGAARYDAFPSLHLLIPLTLLLHDWRWARLRFMIMVGPSLVMLASTIALRLHYAVDLMVSLAIFVMLTFLWKPLQHGNRRSPSLSSL